MSTALTAPTKAEMKSVSATGLIDPASTNATSDFWYALGLSALHDAEKPGLMIGITPIQKYVRQIASLTRGRKANVQQQPGVGTIRKIRTNPVSKDGGTTLELMNNSQPKSPN